MSTSLVPIQQHSSQAGVYKIDFPTNFVYNNEMSYKSVIKNRRLKDSISGVLIAFTSSFCSYRAMDAHA